MEAGWKYRTSMGCKYWTSMEVWCIQAGQDAVPRNFRGGEAIEGQGGQMLLRVASGLDIQLAVIETEVQIWTQVWTQLAVIGTEVQT
eukprot:1157837-Pelagomonas_calceolata.AAC.1